MLKYLNKSYRVIEINLSCPNLLDKNILAYDPQSFELYLKAIHDVDTNNLIIGLKLPPYYETHTFKWVANLLLRYKNIIKFITCINSVVDGLIIQDLHTVIKPKSGFGGIGGQYCKPTALANIHRFYTLLNNNITIIGCGGVKTGRDVFEHILCGATLVQIGTELVREGPSIFSRLNKELIEEMRKYNYTKLDEFRGMLQMT